MKKIINKILRRYGLQIVPLKLSSRWQTGFKLYNFLEIQKMSRIHKWQQIGTMGRKDYVNLERGEGEKRVHMTIHSWPIKVFTELNHPKRGKTRLCRKDLTLKDVEKLLKNPRAHIRKNADYNDLLPWTT